MKATKKKTAGRVLLTPTREAMLLAAVERRMVWARREIRNEALEDAAKATESLIHDGADHGINPEHERAAWLIRKLKT